MSLEVSPTNFPNCTIGLRLGIPTTARLLCQLRVAVQLPSNLSRLWRTWLTLLGNSVGSVDKKKKSFWKRKWFACSTMDLFPLKNSIGGKIHLIYIILHTSWFGVTHIHTPCESSCKVSTNWEHNCPPIEFDFKKKTLLTKWPETNGPSMSWPWCKRSRLMFSPVKTSMSFEPSPFYLH